MAEGPLTIAHVDTESGFSGGQVQVFLLMEGLRRAGHRNLLCCRPGSVEHARAVERGFDVAPVPMRNDLHLSAVWRLRRACVEQSADLVHLHTGRANWLGGWAARLAGLPAITTRRMDRPVGRGLVSRVTYGSLVRRAVAIAPAVERLLAEAGVEPAKLRTICSAVDPEALVPSKGRASVRGSLGVAEGAVMLLGLAKLTRRKGYDVLLRALARHADDPRWTLVLGGDGPERGPLASQAAELGLAERVHLIGKRDDVADLLGACDVFCLPSRAEGLGVAALEAMAAGRPVLGCAVGGLADAVADEVTGLLVPPDDVDALCEAAARLIDDQELRARLGAAGPDRIDQGFSARAMVAAYEALYREVLSEVR